MSKFRERTAAIVEQGGSERKSFQPKGAPAKVYNYWLNNSEGSKAGKIRRGERRENFCHWFWVVVFFAPMLAVGNFIDRHAWVLGLPLLAMIGGLVWAIVSEYGWGDLFWGIGAVALLAGILVAAVYVIDVLGKKYPVAMEKVGIGAVIAAMVGVVGLVLFAFISSTGTVGASIVGVVAVIIGIVVWKFQSIASYIEGREEHRIAEAAKRPAVEAVVREPREPGKVALFFKGFGEFVVMVAQFVRVKKWKTCPLIEVNAPKDAA